MKLYKIAFLIFIMFFIANCSNKNYQLFQEKERPGYNTAFKSKKHFVYKVKPADRLSIIFFEHPELSTKDKNEAENDTGIEVSSTGYILMPLIGKVKVADLSTEEIVTYLYEKYLDFLEKPALKVEVLNQKVYVLGEIKNEGSIPYSNQSLTPVKAIAEAGGLTNQAARENINVIRGSRNSYQIYNINLTDIKSVSQNNITLMPDDIIYVSHNKMKNLNISMDELDPSLSIVNQIFDALLKYRALD